MGTIGLLQAARPMAGLALPGFASSVPSALRRTWRALDLVGAMRLLMWAACDSPTALMSLS